MTWIQQVRKQSRPALRSLQAVIRWRRLRFGEAPPVFGNAKPKSGSHLLVQVLAGLARVAPYRYVQAEPIRTIEKNGARRAPHDILRDLQQLPAGVIGWGYLDPTPENTSFLCQPGRVNYFLYRDPRDMLVSHVHFATDMYEEHGMHSFYKSLPDFGARLQVAITGIDEHGSRMVSVRQRYQGVLDWIARRDVLCLRYEDFLEHRAATLGRMLDQVELAGFRIPCPRPQALSILSDSIQPSRSRTFRSGKAGAWRQHFTAQHKRLFLDVAGDLLVQLEYEKDNDW